MARQCQNAQKHTSLIYPRSVRSIQAKNSQSEVKFPKNLTFKKIQGSNMTMMRTTPPETIRTWLASLTEKPMA